jgi:hypothetical protein
MQRFCSKQCGERERNRFYLYGITGAEVNMILARQGGGCAICKSKSPRTKRNVWHVDHDHLTGVVRGILCHHCNVALGCMADDPARARAMAKYLEAKRPAHL